MRQITLSTTPIAVVYHNGGGRGPQRGSIEMTLLCKVEVTLPRVLGSRRRIMAVVSMSKQEFSSA